MEGKKKNRCTLAIDNSKSQWEINAVKWGGWAQRNSTPACFNKQKCENKIFVKNRKPAFILVGDVELKK